MHASVALADDGRVCPAVRPPVGGPWLGKRFIPETLFDDLGFRMTYRSRGCSTRCRPSTSTSCCSSTSFFGKVLMLDGATQVTTKDEFVYHEMMTHVPIFAHGKAQRSADCRRR